jgi:uncharacterized membrane protein YdbT with pleckstrin-like domain
MNDDRLLLEARPSWRHFFWYFFFFFLIIPPILAIWKKYALVFRVYEDRVSLEKGILSKKYTELFIKDIRTINVNQGITQRVFNIGNVMIATAGTFGYELSMYGLPGPVNIKNLIIEQVSREHTSQDQ